MRPPMSYHEFFTYLMLYLSYIKKIILISHFLAAIGHIERNNQKSSIFGISAKFSSLPWGSQTLKMAENGMRMHLYTYKHEYQSKKYDFLFQLMLTHYISKFDSVRHGGADGGAPLISA